MLCGLPGSGKTTLATQLAARLEDAEVVEAEAVGARKGQYEKLKARLDGLAAERSYIILDGAFFRREVRQAVYGMGFAVLLVYLKCPLRVCLQRNELRNEAIDSGGVIVLHQRFQPPDQDESPVVVHTEQVTADVAARLAHRAIDLIRSGPSKP